MTDSTHGPDEARRRPHAGSDETSELPVVGSPGPRADQPGDRTLDIGKQPQAQQAQGAAAYGAGQPAPAMTQRPYGRVGNEPVPGPYGAGGNRELAGERKYGTFLPALVAGVLAAGLTIVLGFSAESLARARNQWVSSLGIISGYFDARQYTTQFRFDSTAQFAAATVVGLVTVLLTLLAALSATRAAARGLIFFAVWGIVAIGASLAAIAGPAASGTLRSQPFEVTYGAMYGALWGVVFGWIPALGAAVTRIGRRR